MGPGKPVINAGSRHSNFSNGKENQVKPIFFSAIHKGPPNSIDNDRLGAHCVVYVIVYVHPETLLETWGTKTRLKKKRLFENIVLSEFPLETKHTNYLHSGKLT